MGNILFSIIVPVYNVEKYLRTCIDSILKQKYKDFELILVDDGSPDDCGIICDEYKNKDDRICVLHKKNGGLLSAWKEGLSIASGEYIVSVDSDDFVDDDLLEQIKSILDEYDSDVIVYGYRSVRSEEDRGTKNVIQVSAGYYDVEEIKNQIVPGLINGGSFEKRSNIYLSRVNKCIKKNLLIENSVFYECDIEYGEDNLWTVPNVLSAKGIYVMADFYPYNYRLNPNSITHSYNQGLWDKFRKLDRYLIDLLHAKGYERQDSQIYCDSVFHAAVAINNVMLEHCDKGEKLRQIQEIVEDDFVEKGISCMDRSKCSIKERFNLRLMKKKAFRLIYMIKKIQKEIW